MSSLFSNVYVSSFGISLPAEVVSTAFLDEKLTSIYKTLMLPPDTIRAKTGIINRRFWPHNESVVEGAVKAAQDALARAQCSPKDLDVLIYGGVCRAAIEPATASYIAERLGLRDSVLVYDVSNACLGMLNGMIDIASRIELGQINTGMIVGCESAREIIEETLGRLQSGNVSAEFFQGALPTMTGGSGAAAVILTNQKRSSTLSHRLAGVYWQGAFQHSHLCRWEFSKTTPPVDGQNTPAYEQTLTINGRENLKAGIALAVATWPGFLKTMGWRAADIDKIITHQVGKINRDMLLTSLNLNEAIDFPTFEQLGNMGAVSVPATVALAERDGFFTKGQRIGLLGIGSGLNCMMLGLEW
jgi:3-oxoacyl-[acyl-carrier-protein] synthase-3